MDTPSRTAPLSGVCGAVLELIYFVGVVSELLRIYILRPYALIRCADL